MLSWPSRASRAGARALAVATVTLAAACAPVVSEPCEPLGSATTAAVVDGAFDAGTERVRALASVSRNFTPGLFPSIPGRSGIGVGITLIAVQDPQLPGIIPSCVRVERNGEAWQTRMESGRRGTDGQGQETLAVFATGSGPHWEPGALVRVTAWLRIKGTLTAVDFGELVVRKVE